jgi:hypothetical protein
MFTDPATGRPYTVDPATGRTVWADQPPTSRPKKSHTLRNLLLIGGGVFVAFVVGMSILTALINSVPTPTATDTVTTQDAGSEPSAAEPAKTMPKIGQSVRDGKFEFTVLKVKAGVAKVGDEFLGSTAQGQYVLVTIKVTNIGNEARMFTGSNQALFDTRGRKFEASEAAAIYLGDQSKSFLTDINPGNGVTGVVVFDVPKGVTLDHIKLHDSMFSGGEDVSLR